MLSVAEIWFERRSFDVGVTLITEPYVDRFLRRNIWHVRGSDPIPLDIGDFDDASRAMMRTAGYAIPATLLTALPYRGFEPRAHVPLPAPPTHLLAEGDVVDLGDRAFEVLHLPGHSPGSIGLWERHTGVLFSGDALYDGPLLDELPGSDIDAYVATMRRLRAWPVSVVHGGHKPSFGRARLVELVDAYLARHGT